MEAVVEPGGRGAVGHREADGSTDQAPLDKVPQLGSGDRLGRSTASHCLAVLMPKVTGT